MQYISTRDREQQFSASQAIAKGLAEDGGLLTPVYLPKLPRRALEELKDMSYQQRAVYVMKLFLDEFSVKELTDFANAAYGPEKFDTPAVAPVRALDGNTYCLELWHGPTCAFKDMALQMLPHLLTASLRKQEEEKTVCILVATSGDTGKGALEGFRDVDRTKILVFYPKDGVSAIQELQMVTQEGANVGVCSVVGNFDDAQTGVKRLFSDEELRERLASGTGENLLPPAVYGYILRNHLYGTDVNLKNLTLSQLRPVALSYLKHKRIPHVLGTEQEAIRLATRYGADVEKARVAALLHDCTKKLDMPEQLALCRQYGIELDELEQKALKLLHAKTGAAIAREVFGVDDEIYRAIWWHTTGHADMTLLEKIIYLADYIEPSRDFPGVNDLRACVYENLDRGMLMGLEMTIDEMTEMGNPVHHATMEARDWLKGKR